jgi:hypothetical protein
MLLLAQSYAQIGAINKFSGVVAKSVSINLRKWFLSPTGLIKPWFHTKENLPLCSLYLPLGVPNWVASTANQSFSLKSHQVKKFYGGVREEEQGWRSTNDSKI